MQQKNWKFLVLVDYRWHTVEMIGIAGRDNLLHKHLVIHKI